MDTASQVEEKKPRKYSKIDRATQSQVINEAWTMTREDLAKKYKISRTTLQHWITRKEKLKNKRDRREVEFFESSCGQAWLHQLVLASFMIFYENGNSGTPGLHEFFEMIGIDAFIGSSISALQKVGDSIEKEIIAYENEEKSRLVQEMPEKNFVGAVDENFIMDKMTLILMDPASDYILTEEFAESRDAETWHRVTQSAVKAHGSKVRVQQFIGDEASGLVKLATSKVGVIKGPDLFHGQQDITRGVTAPLSRVLQQARQKQEALQEAKKNVFNKFGDHLKQAGEINSLSKRGMNAGLRVVEIEAEEKRVQKQIANAEEQYRQAQEARRRISQTYHPFNLDTGERQDPEIVRAELKTAYTDLEAVSEKAGLTDKQKQKLEKSKSLIGSMVEILCFFFAFLASMIKTLGLDGSNALLFEKLVSIEYLKLRLQRSKKKKCKDKIRITLKKMEEDLKTNPIWEQMNPAVQTVWLRKALECAQVFQRSSSCVEGRNGQLALKFHAFRRLNPQKLKVLTILHNFFIKRADGTTAAERFFEARPKDLFTWILGKVELPRPRKKHTRRPRMGKEKQAA